MITSPRRFMFHCSPTADNTDTSFTSVALLSTSRVVGGCSRNCHCMVDSCLQHGRRNGAIGRLSFLCRRRRHRRRSSLHVQYRTSADRARSPRCGWCVPQHTRKSKHAKIKPRRRRLDGFLEVVWPGLRVQIDLRGEVHSSRGAVSSTASAVRASGSRSRYCRTCARDRLPRGPLRRSG